MREELDARQEGYSCAREAREHRGSFAVSHARQMTARPWRRGKTNVGRVACACAVGFFLAVGVWRLWPRDYSERLCRQNLGVIYIAATRVVTGEDPKPPPPLRGSERKDRTRRLTDLSMGETPALAEVFDELVTEFWITPAESHYLDMLTGRDGQEAIWQWHLPDAQALLCPRDPLHEKKSGYFSLARSWTKFHDLPASSYAWNPEPHVLAVCVWHRLKLMKDGSVQRY